MIPEEKPEESEDRLIKIQSKGNVHILQEIHVKPSQIPSSDEDPLLVSENQPSSIKQGEVEEKLAKVEKWIEQKSRKNVQKKLWIGFGIALLVWISLAALTWKLGWEVMEPWTYFIGVVVILIQYAYFAISQEEFSPRRIYDTLVNDESQKFLREMELGEKFKFNQQTDQI